MEDYDYVYRARRHKATFRMIKRTFFNASDRRFRHGAATSITRALYAEAYRYTHGMRITRPLYDYTMGGPAVKEKSEQET